MVRFVYIFITLIFFLPQAFAQKTATLTGKVIDENNQPLVGVSIEIIGKQKGGISNDSGFFSINITP
ncbi:MAG: hypothetical protein KBF36_01025, partial [Chitinophagaceae bacterium]|nr:hypothetical protein [Chitinophagaceae bacterium]MBP9739241.1 hypothetical protein [Chitinophagaceae bacterium]